MSIFQLTVTTDDNAAQVSNLLSPTVSVHAGDVWEINRAWSEYFGAVVDGARNTVTTYADTMVVATGTITVAAGGSTNGQTMTLGNITLTAKTSSADPTMGEFNISATAATQAASMVVAINTVAGLSGVVTATNLLGVITVTSSVPGTIGNAIQLDAGNLSNVTISAFANGAQSHTSTVSSNK